MKFKNLLIAVLMILGIISAKAQNPPMPDPARGVTIINGRIGVSTNGATASQVLTYNGTAVVWGAGGGGGGDVTQAGQNNFTGYNTLAGPTLFSGAVTNTSLLVMPLAYSINPSGQRFFYHQNGQPWADFNQDFGDTGLYYTNGQRAISISFGSGGTGGSMQFNDASGVLIANIGGGATRFRATGGSESVLVDGRSLNYGNGQVSAFWWFGNPGMQVNGALTNAGSTVIATNLTTRGGRFIKFVTTPTNYTSSTMDEMVSYRGTTLGAVTNFLPAISTTVTNGFILTIKDGQSSAALTNIVLFPNGSDTVDGATSHTINANNGAVDVVVDGPNKRWLVK